MDDYFFSLGVSCHLSSKHHRALESKENLEKTNDPEVSPVFLNNKGYHC